jgi:ParB/RepB/Spo0J family partition protein
MNIEWMKIDAVKPYPANARKNDDTVGQIVKSLEKYGWQQPIVVDPNMVIVVGHTRYKAAIELGYEQIPVVVAELNDKQAKAYRIMDNKSHDYTRWDVEELKYELESIDDIEATMFSLKELDEILHPELGLIGGKKRGKVKGVHRVIVECKDREHMEKVYSHCRELGYWNIKTNYY